MMRGFLLHPAAWLILFVVVAVTVYLALTIISGTSQLGQRLLGDWRKQRRWNREWPNLDAGWAIDLEPVDEGSVVVRWRDRQTLTLQEMQLPLRWIPKKWHSRLEKAEAERAQRMQLDQEAFVRWQDLRKIGWRVIRLGEELEAAAESGHEWVASTNRAGLMHWMDAGLAGLQYLANNRQIEKRRIVLQAEVETAQQALQFAPEETNKRSLETALRAQQERLAHLEEHLALIPRVMNDLDCLEANLLLAEEKLEAVRSPLQLDHPTLFAPSDAPLFSLELPLLEQLRHEQQAS